MIKKLYVLLLLAWTACCPPPSAKYGDILSPTGGLARVTHDGTMTGNGTPTSPLSALASGWSNAEVFGTGVDGNLTFDGSTTIKGIVPSGNKYVLNRDIFGATIVVNNGVDVDESNYAILASVLLTNNGTIENDGASASGCGSNNNGVGGPANGSAGVARFYPTIAGVNGGGPGTASGAAPYGYASTSNISGGAGGSSPAGTGGNGGAGTCTGGGGGGSSNGAGGVGGGLVVSSPNILATPKDFFYGGAPYSNAGSTGVLTTHYTWGASGGSGQTCAFCGSGGGGAGGGLVYIAARTINGTGAIHSRGGNGCGGNGIGGGGGGGGGGGPVVIVYGTKSGQTIDANGGTHGAGGSAPGGDGGSCFIILDNLSHDGT